MGGLEDRIRLSLFAELQKNHLMLVTQAKRVGILPTNLIAENPLLLLVYGIGLDAGFREAWAIVDYAKLTGILSNDHIYGGDRAIP
jgi:hypothetical protein